MTDRECSKCGVRKTQEHFYANKNQCKACISQVRKVHYDANADKMRARCRAYYNQYCRRPAKEVAQA